MSFDPTKHLISIRRGSKPDYLPVAARIAWMRDEHPSWGIETEAITIDLEGATGRGGYAIFKATIRDETGRILAQATKMEDAKGFPDFVEKAESSSVGRALAMCGYGTLNCFEFEEGDRRIVDSPIEQPPVESAEEYNARQQEARKRVYLITKEIGAPLTTIDRERVLLQTFIRDTGNKMATPEEYNTLHDIIRKNRNAKIDLEALFATQGV